LISFYVNSILFLQKRVRCHAYFTKVSKAKAVAEIVEEKKNKKEKRH